MEEESLWKQIRKLSAENQVLKDLLRRNGIDYNEYVGETCYEESESYDPDQGARIIHPRVIDRNSAVYFYSRFWGREDVYALRFVSKKTGKPGYSPQCNNRWNSICPRQQGKNQRCQDCKHQQFKRLEPADIIRHLMGRSANATDVVGIYPMLSDDTCRFLVFDFDNHKMGAEKEDFANADDEWREEVDSIRQICSVNCIPHLVERSRSGRGAHLWIFFSEKVPAATARRFGLSLLDKGAYEVNLKSFRYYDRMFPSQDHLSEGGIGNLIALPLQGQALREGNSAFVDEDWNAYPDQWETLRNTQSLSRADIEKKINEWSRFQLPEEESVYDENGNRIKPWKIEKSFNKTDVSGVLHITLANRIYVDAINVTAAMKNKIRRLAIVSNQTYYVNRSLGIENFDTPSRFYLGYDENGYIVLPRGLLEVLTEKLETSGISYQIEDDRKVGRGIHAEFNGVLKDVQKTALNELSQHNIGILQAATSFGKTVVCCAMIAEKKTNTLILLHSSALMDQWMDAINTFLKIDEELPTYKTKTGRVRTRTSVVGRIQGAHDSSTGIIDIAMVGSLCKKGVYHERLKEYGMVIVDECHHAASDTFAQVLNEIRAKHVYGVTATPKRGDGLEKINYMLLGPIRHRYTSKERAIEQGIDHLVIPRFTRTVLPRLSEERVHISKAYEAVRDDKVRDDLIVSDVTKAIAEGRTPVILSKYTAMTERFFERLRCVADHVFIMTGKDKKANQKTREEMMCVPRDETMLLVATGQLIGEGFDLPRLDTLFMATPIRGDQIVEQYAGRLNRDYDGKKNVLVYDYVDGHIPQFDKMYHQRLKAYRKIGYELYSDLPEKHQSANAIYGYDNYQDVFRTDLLSANKEIVISSPVLSGPGVNEMTRLLSDRQNKGVSVTVITLHPDSYGFGKTDFWAQLQDEMRQAGFGLKLTEGYCERYTIVDREIVWYGSLNFLGKPDADDNLMRVMDKEIAEELLMMTFGADE